MPVECSAMQMIVSLTPDPIPDIMPDHFVLSNCGFAVLLAAPVCAQSGLTRDRMNKEEAKQHE